MEDSTYILNPLRTPIGSFSKSLKNFSAAQLGAILIEELVKRSRISPSFIDQVILGNTVGAGTGQNLARQAAVLAKLPSTIPAYTVNNVCGAGLQAIILAAQAIEAQRAEIILAGGTESASQAPALLSQHEDQEEKVDSLLHDGLFCSLTNKRMGDLAEIMAEEEHISRREQDELALASHRKAIQAQKQGKFAKEIVPIRLSSENILNEDERPRKNVSIEKFSVVASAFSKNGTVTAGNSSVPSDGAALVSMASDKGLKKLKAKPLARIVSYASIAVDPKDVFRSPVPAITECLKSAKNSLNDIDIFEISEAFAVQGIYTQKMLKIPVEKINIFGGDIALGHPLGAAGARILTTLCYALEDQKKKRGLACISYGGGGCLAVLIERV